MLQDFFAPNDTDYIDDITSWMDDGTELLAEVDSFMREVAGIMDDDFDNE